HDQLADLAGSPSAAGSPGNVVDALSHELRRFWHARGKTATREHRQIHPIIAHVSGGGSRGAQAADQAVESSTLVTGALFDERDAKLCGAPVDRARTTSRKARDPGPG